MPTSRRRIGGAVVGQPVVVGPAQRGFEHGVGDAGEEQPGGGEQHRLVDAFGVEVGEAGLRIPPARGRPGSLHSGAIGIGSSIWPSMMLRGRPCVVADAPRRAVEEFRRQVRSPEILGLVDVAVGVDHPELSVPCLAPR